MADFAAAARRAAVAASVALCAPLCGCLTADPAALGEDQLGYSRALADSEKRQTLLNVVRLRYGDMPVFLDTTQVIASSQVQRSFNGSIELFPNASAGTFLGAGGSAQVQESPTFTFQPVAGDHFTQGFLRPLSTADLLPLVEGGLPIDVLFRLSVQAVGGLRNSIGLEQQGGAGSPEFFQLLHDLRKLQISGLLGVRLVQDKRAGADGKAVFGPAHVYLSFGRPREPSVAETMGETRRLLGLSLRVAEAEVVYGRTPSRPGEIALLTRPMLGVLGQLAFQVEVPEADVARHRTMASVGLVDIERRPAVVIHSASTHPEDAFAAVEYGGRWFWIDDDDFDSKLAFTMVNILLALAKTSSAPGTVITIPAG